MNHFMHKLLSIYWSDVGGPLALKLKRLHEEGKYSDILDIVDSINFNGFYDPKRLARVRATIDVIRKADWLPVEIDRDHACLEKALLAEKLCRTANYWFSNYEDGGRCSPLLIKWIPRVRSYIKRLLGPIPDLQYIYSGFGPGSTLSNSRRHSSVYHKLAAIPTYSTSCGWFIPALPSRLRDVWGDVESWIVTEANQFQTVPKSYKNNRAIAKEPLLNAWCQRYIGDAIRKRLLRYHIDLSTAPELHRDLAKKASVTLEWATLDASMASDTISRKLVEVLLPKDWYKILAYARTRYTDYGEYYHKYPDLFREYGVSRIQFLEKFSSMGNGFTFELETVIFHSICTVVSGQHCPTFGDDMIVPRVNAKEVIEVLEAFGFTINKDKSFFTGLFRESCGGDFLNGEDVRGEFIKILPRSASEFFDLHNRLWLLQRKRNYCLKRTLNFLRCQVPKHLRLSIPEWMGDGGFFDENPRGRWMSKLYTYQYRVYRPINRFKRNWFHDFDPNVVLAGALMNGSSKGPTSDFELSYKLTWVPPTPKRK